MRERERCNALCVFKEHKSLECLTNFNFNQYFEESIGEERCDQKVEP